jgi:hypothetical protein
MNYLILLPCFPFPPRIPPAAALLGGLLFPAPPLNLDMLDDIVCSTVADKTFRPVLYQCLAVLIAFILNKATTVLIFLNLSKSQNSIIILKRIF